MVDDSVPSGSRSQITNNLLAVARRLQEAKVKYAQEFLLAKSQSREGSHISDRMAEAMATVATHSEVDFIEAELSVWYNMLEHSK